MTMIDDETLTGYERKHLQALVRMFHADEGNGLRVEVDACREQGLDVGSLLRAAGHLCYACAANAPDGLRREYAAHADHCFKRRFPEHRAPAPFHRHRPGLASG
jgi:hypothetical protein